MVSSGDDGIFLLFLGKLPFRSKLNSLWLFVIFTHLSVCCLIGFLLRILEFVSSLSLLRWYLLFSTVLVSCVHFFIWLCQMFHTSYIFWKSWKTFLIAGCQKHHLYSLYSSWLCPFFSIDKCWCLMVLTKHVIRLNQYNCLIPRMHCSVW